MEGTGLNFVPYALFNGEGRAAEHEMVLACINSERVPQHMQRNSLIDPLPFYSYLQRKCLKSAEFFLWEVQRREKEEF